MSEPVPPPALSFRPVTPDDHAFLRAVYASTRQDEMALTGWPEAEIEAFLDLQFHFQQIQWLENYPHASFALILCAGVPVGRLYLNRQPSDLRILEIALLPAYRQRGIGRAIFMELIAEAERTHCRLSLHVERHNPIRGFYERLGFQPICARGILFYMERPPRA